MVDSSVKTLTHCTVVVKRANLMQGFDKTGGIIKVLYKSVTQPFLGTLCTVLVAAISESVAEPVKNGAVKMIKVLECFA